MKKVTLLLLLVIVASTLLMAAAPLKLVRVWTINKSGHTIYMKLEGMVEENFYYLTIPWGDTLMPDHSSYTIVQDIYSRETWYGPGDYDCEGLKSSGELWAIKQMKLTFTPCGRINEYWDTGKILYGEPSWGEKVSYWEWVDAYGVVGGLGCWWVVGTVKYRSPNRYNCYFLYKY
jgi:hypothetical protein